MLSPNICRLEKSCMVDIYSIYIGSYVHIETMIFRSGLSQLGMSLSMDLYQIFHSIVWLGQQVMLGNGLQII